MSRQDAVPSARPLRAAVAGSSLSIGAMVLLWTVCARADGHDKVAAEALFEAGRRLVAAGNLEAACPKFAESQRLDPSAATLLNLASCYEKSGHTASGWVTYREAASAADAAGRADYVATAQRHAEAIASKLGRLTVKVEQPVAGLQIARDGAPLAPATWGEPIPIDAGSHTLEASAPGFKGWASSVTTQDGVLAALIVPALEPLPVPEPLPRPPAPSPIVAPPPPPPAVAPAPPEPSHPGGAQRTTGVVLGAAGLVGLGLAGAFSVVAKNDYNGSLVHCETGNPGLCDATGLSQRSTARGYGDAASVAVGVGAAALAGGLVVWITAPQRSQSEPRASARVGLVPAPGGAILEGEW